MIATIDGITVMGSPEEIQRFREITAKKKTTTDILKYLGNGVPEHVKRYSETPVTYILKETKINSWF